MTKRDKALKFAWNYFYGRTGMEYSEEDVIALADSIMSEEQHSSNYTKMLAILIDYQHGTLDGGFQQLKSQVLELIVQMESEKARYVMGVDKVNVPDSSVTIKFQKGVGVIEHICQSRLVDKSVIEPILLELHQSVCMLENQCLHGHALWPDYTSAMNKLYDALSIPY